MSRRLTVKKQPISKERVENIKEERDTVLNETNYLLSTQNNMERLLRSLKQARFGQVFTKELTE